jgi:hypothetical protein
MLVEEIAALRNELAKRDACAHECPRCGGSATESGRFPREGESESTRLAALARSVEEIGPSITRAIVERFRDHKLHNPESRQ